MKSSKLTRREERRFFNHEYLRDSIFPRYKECESCKIRTQLTCLICNFCSSISKRILFPVKIDKKYRLNYFKILQK